MTDLQKPYINLNQDFPGIVSLFMYDRDVAKIISDMGQTIMRRPRSLSVGERELIASFVSKLNECEFCCQSHTACAREFVDPFTVDQFLDGQDSEVLTPKLSALMAVAACVQGLDRQELPRVISLAKELGACDEDIHDTVLVTAMFSMCNRYVDGLGTTFRQGEPQQGGRSLAHYGYTMGVRRFFREVFPKLWSKFWG